MKMNVSDNINNFPVQDHTLTDDADEDREDFVKDSTEVYASADYDDSSSNNTNTEEAVSIDDDPILRMMPVMMMMMIPVMRMTKKVVWHV